MVTWISSWAEAIILAVIIATIIEMILPEGSSKKYIKVVIGVYILFTIISPVISNFTGKTLAVSDMLDLNQYIEDAKQKENAQNKLQEENAASIRDIYIGNLKSDIQNKLKQKGYVVTDIQLDVANNHNYTLNKITLWVDKEEQEDGGEEVQENNQLINEIQEINEIHIQVSNEAIQTNTSKSDEKKESNLNNSDKKKIKEYLSSVYEIKEKNIIVY